MLSNNYLYLAFIYKKSIEQTIMIVCYQNNIEKKVGQAAQNLIEPGWYFIWQLWTSIKQEPTLAGTDLILDKTPT